jgi:hypothetical protein
LPSLYNASARAFRFFFPREIGMMRGGG